MSIEAEYQRRCRTPSDMVDHLPTLREYASRCRHVTEFGVFEGNSTVAFLASGCKRLVSHDTKPCLELNAELRQFTDRAAWDFRNRNVLEIEPIEPTDLLLIDDFHTGLQLDADLELHAHRVARWIFLHDTESSKWTHGPTGLQGLWPVVLSWCGIADPHQIRPPHKSPEWTIKRHWPNCCGLTLLERTRSADPNHTLNPAIVEAARESSRAHFDEAGQWRFPIHA